jgi:hypothetical protein
VALNQSFGFEFGVGISYGGAMDPEDGGLPASAFTWKVEYLTNTSGTPTIHPFVAEFSGTRTGSFTPAVTGAYTLTDVAYRVTLTVRDSLGTATTKTFDVLPNVANLTIQATLAGLGLTLDPSHYIYGPHAGGNYDQVIKHVYNVHLRDTTKDKLQVRVGQGLVEYGRLITQLAKNRYNRDQGCKMFQSHEHDPASVCPSYVSNTLPVIAPPPVWGSTLRWRRGTERAGRRVR